MKAIVYHNTGSGGVLRLEEIEKPVPKEDDVLIKVRAGLSEAAEAVGYVEEGHARGKVIIDFVPPHDLSTAAR